MAKKEKKNKPSVKVDDLGATKNPKGGAYDAFLKFQTIQATEQKASDLKSTLKVNSALQNKYSK